MALPTIGTLWIGPELSWLEQLCIQSFLDNGHKLVFYSYAPVQGVPSGVTHADANDILPSDKIIRHARTGSPAYHADVFRLHMLKQTDYIWADTDAFCVKPWKRPKNKHFHGWISDKKPQVNNGVLGLPKDSKTLKAMLEFTSDEYPIPPWLPVARKAELQALKDKGEGMHVSLMPWGVWGPDAVTHFLKETGEIEHSFPGHVIYPFPFKTAGLPMNPSRYAKAKALIKDDTLSIHFWGRRFRNIVAKYGGVPKDTAYVAELLKRHNIDPTKTAHLMQLPEPTEEVKPVTRTLDFSMFDVQDVANLILQRSEVGDVGQEIRDWLEGDGAGLLAYAKTHFDRILTETFDIAQRECDFFTKATDSMAPKSVADIGCGYAFADLVLFNRYGCKIILIDIEESKERHFGFEGAGAGYTSLKKAKKFLTKNGVPAKKITLNNPNTQSVPDIGKVDLAISLASCGFHYPVETYKEFFATQISSGGGIVLDIRKGSGGIKTLKSFGTVEVLEKHPKYSTVISRV